MNDRVCAVKNETDEGYYYWSRYEPEDKEEWQRPTKNSQAMNGLAVAVYRDPNPFLTCHTTIPVLAVIMGFVFNPQTEMQQKKKQSFFNPAGPPVFQPQYAFLKMKMLFIEINHPSSSYLKKLSVSHHCRKQSTKLVSD